MSRSGLIALIVIAVLTVAAGVYWYMEFMPLADVASKQQTEAPASPPTEQVATRPEREVEVEPAIEISSPPPFEPFTEASAPPPTEQVATRPEREVEVEPAIEISPPPPFESLNEEFIDIDEIEAEQMVDELEVDEQEAEPLVDEFETELPPAAVEVPYTEVEVTIIPFSDLEEIIGSELFALASPLDIDLTALKPKPEQPVVSELVPPVPVEAEEIEPMEVEQEIVTDVAFDEPIESVPVAVVETHPTPTPRMEKETQEQFWNAELRVSAVSLALPSFKGEGFDFELGLLHRHDELFSWGGGLAAGKNATDWMLDLVGSARWTFAPQATFSYPLTISLGPSVLFSATPAFGLVARVSGGVNFKITDSFSLFYELGLSGRWYLGDDFSFAFEPARIGFSYSF